MRTYFLIGFFLTLLPNICNAADRSYENIFPKVCVDGPHKQPNGEFAVYVFCDDAQGTNIAIFHGYPGDSLFEKWPINRRFWQGEPWTLDVSSIGWVPNKNLLVVATSEIYGEGSIYLLDLEKQKFKVLLVPKDCGASILAISETTVTIGFNNCSNEEVTKKVVLKLSQSNPALKQDAP